MSEIKSFIKEGFDAENCSLEELEAEMNRCHDLEDFYESKQLGEKLFLNSMYGAVSSKYFVGFNLEVSKSITLQGQDLNHFSENCVNRYFSGVFQNDVELHKKLGIKTEDAQKVSIGKGGMLPPSSKAPHGVHFYSDEEKKELGLTYLEGNYSATCAGDTDSQNSLTINYLDQSRMTVEDMFTKLKYENNDIVLRVANGSEVVPVKNHTTKSFTMEDGVVDRPLKYIMRHKVTKAKWRLRTSSGKEIIVTGDHSLMVLRDGKLLEIKPKDVNPKTDKIITLDIENETFD